MKAKTLPGFTGIEFIDVRRLFINCGELVREGSTIEAYGVFTRLPAEGLIGCGVSCETLLGESVYTTVLNFMMKDLGNYTRRLLHDLTLMDCSFRLSDIYREQYLVGLNTKPHPTIKSVSS
jgi:hypothetical protein